MQTQGDGGGNIYYLQPLLQKSIQALTFKRSPPRISFRCCRRPSKRSQDLGSQEPQREERTGCSGSQNCAHCHPEREEGGCTSLSRPNWPRWIQSILPFGSRHVARPLTWDRTELERPRSLFLWPSLGRLDSEPKHTQHGGRTCDRPMENKDLGTMAMVSTCPPWVLQRRAVGNMSQQASGPCIWEAHLGNR